MTKLTDPQRETLKAEAIRKLKNYLLTGLEGFKQQGLDRVEALGIDTGRCRTTKDDILHLIGHVTVYG